MPTGRNCRGCLKLPWKAPNYPKTPPTGMKHNYESFGATLGPFGYLILGFGPQNGSKANIIVFWAPFGLVSGLTGIQNTSTQCAWVGRINIMCLGPLTDLCGTPGAPKRARFGPKRPFWGPQRSLGSPGGPDLGPTATGWSNWVGHIHTMCLGP